MNSQTKSLGSLPPRTASITSRGWTYLDRVVRHGRSRRGAPSACASRVRVRFGPPLPTQKRNLTRLLHRGSTGPDVILIVGFSWPRLNGPSLRVGPTSAPASQTRSNPSKIIRSVFFFFLSTGFSATKFTVQLPVGGSEQQLSRARQNLLAAGPGGEPHPRNKWKKQALPSSVLIPVTTPGTRKHAWLLLPVPRAVRTLLWITRRQNRGTELFVSDQSRAGRDTFARRPSSGKSADRCGGCRALPTFEPNRRGVDWSAPVGGDAPVRVTWPRSSKSVKRRRLMEMHL